MTILRHTYRIADGERIPGTWRHVFIRNVDYHLTDLLIYADGMVDCWGLVTLEEFEGKLRSGWVATELPDGARASGHHLASWEFAEARSWVTPEMLLGEVRDTVDELNGRPDSTARCHAALEAFRADPGEERRAALQAAYLAIPEHVRHYALGDMDHKDGPLKVLAAGVGGRLGDTMPVVTEEAHRRALAYFDERDEAVRRFGGRQPADGADEARAPALELPAMVFPNGWPDDPGKLVLRNDYPAAVVIAGETFPSVTHAYWALSTDDAEVRERIRALDNPFQAERAARAATRREGWEQSRAAVMAALLRAKFAQHPELAQVLLGTGDATLLYVDPDSRFWSRHGASGRNWMGRLLELVRAELTAARAGLVS